jgi:hypothetical protein
MTTVPPTIYFRRAFAALRLAFAEYFFRHAGLPNFNLRPPDFFARPTDFFALRVLRLRVRIPPPVGVSARCEAGVICEKP